MQKLAEIFTFCSGQRHNAMLAAQLGHRHTAFGLTQDRPSRQIALQSPAGQWMICASAYLLVFIRNLLMHLAEKILLVQPLTFGGDYLPTVTWATRVARPAPVRSRSVPSTSCQSARARPLYPACPDHADPCRSPSLTRRAASGRFRIASIETQSRSRRSPFLE